MSGRLLALAAATLVAGGCFGGDDEASRGPPPGAPPAASPTAPPPATDPRAADIPRRYVDSAYAGGLWSPKRVSGCGRVATQAPAAVYFGCEPPLVPAAAARPLARREATPRRALRALLRGPTREERRAGFVSNFGRETAALPFSFRLDRDRRYAVVDLDRRILDVEFVFVSVLDVAQIVSTVGQFAGIDWVVVLVGGQPLCEALGEC